MLIEQGRVSVDGAKASLGQKVDPAEAHIEIDGIPLPVAPGLVYYLLYKPVGVVSTAHDPGGRSTIVDLVPSEPRVFPIGRLDADSEGLIILTNDGDLTLRLTHPRYGVEKTYVALVSGVPSNRDRAHLTDGVELDDGPAAAVRARQLARHRDSAMIELVMTEGRNREVRRMLEAIGHPVMELVRTAIGPIKDRDLEPGTYRILTIDEIRQLYQAVATDG